jgi:hypothetical protein
LRRRACGVLTNAEDGKQKTEDSGGLGRQKGGPNFRPAFLVSVFCYTRCLLCSVLGLLLGQMTLLAGRGVSMNQSLAGGAIKERSCRGLVGGGGARRPGLLHGGAKGGTLRAVALSCALRLSHVLPGGRNTRHEVLFSSEVVGHHGRAPGQCGKAPTKPKGRMSWKFDVYRCKVKAQRHLRCVNFLTRMGEPLAFAP